MPPVQNGHSNVSNSNSSALMTINEPWMSTKLTLPPMEACKVEPSPHFHARRDDDSARMLFGTPAAARPWFCVQTTWGVPVKAPQGPSTSSTSYATAASTSASTATSTSNNIKLDPSVQPPPSTQQAETESGDVAMSDNASADSASASSAAAAGEPAQSASSSVADESASSVVVPPAVKSADSSPSSSSRKAFSSSRSSAAELPDERVTVNMRLARGEVSVLGRKALTLLGYHPMKSASNPAYSAKVRVSRHMVRLWAPSSEGITLHNIGKTPLYCVSRTAFARSLRASQAAGIDPLSAQVPPASEKDIPRLPATLFGDTAHALEIRENQHWVKVNPGEACSLSPGDVFTLQGIHFPFVVMRDDTCADADPALSMQMRGRVGQNVQVFRRGTAPQRPSQWVNATVEDVDPICRSLRLRGGDGVVEWRLESHLNPYGARAAESTTPYYIPADPDFGSNGGGGGGSRKRPAGTANDNAERRSRRQRQRTSYADWDEQVSDDDQDFYVSFRPAIRDPPVRIAEPETSLYWNHEKPPTYYFYHAICLQHLVPPGHIEVPERLESILDTLRELRDTYPQQLRACDEFRLMTREELRLVHPEWYLYRLQHMVSQVQQGRCSFVPHMSEQKRAECARQFAIATGAPSADASADGAAPDISGFVGADDSLDAEDYHDTFVSSMSVEAANAAVSAVAAAIDHVMTGKARNAFCAVRPPGHHCGEQGPGMSAVTQGFCLMNNVVLAATYAQNVYGATGTGVIRKIAVIDFDVHHGNGSEEILAGRPGYLFCSIHVGDLYPNTGTGPGSAPNIVNVSLPRRCPPDLFQQRFEEDIIRAVDRFAPDLIMISAGFDGHFKDPTEGMMLAEEDYAVITRKIKQLAARHCNDRIVSVLEGGYSLTYLKRCVAQHVLELAKKS